MTLLPWILAAMAVLSPGKPHGELATAIAYAVEDERPLFAGDDGQLRTASFLVAIAFRESSFDNSAVSRTNDHCSFQIHARPELANDVDACVRVAMGMLRESMRICPAANALGLYATGNCTADYGKRISRDRMWLAASLITRLKDGVSAPETR